MRLPDMDEYQELNPHMRMSGINPIHNATEIPGVLPPHQYVQYTQLSTGYPQSHMPVSQTQAQPGPNGLHAHITPSAMTSMRPGHEWSGYMGQSFEAQSTQTRGIYPPPKGTQSLRSKISERLQQIDREAFESKERQYQQKSEEIQHEIQQVLRGTHPLFLEGVSRLSAEKDRILISSEYSHKYLVSVYEQIYKQERDAAEKAYKQEKQAIYDKIAADIDERRKRLKEEKDNLDISMDFVLDTNSRTSSKRNLRKRGHDSLGLGETSSRYQNKRKHAQGNTMQGIPEEDIVNDLIEIRRVTGVTGPLGNGSSGKKGGKGHKR